MKLLNFINNKYFKYFLFLNLIEFLDLIITNIKKNILFNERYHNFFKIIILFFELFFIF